VKRRWKLLLGLVALLSLAAVSLPLWIDGAARGALEAEASKALGVPTELEDVDIELFGGTCTMSTLVVSNPEGFDEPHFLRMQTGSVAVTLDTLLQDEVRLPEVVLEEVDLRLERKALKTNYGTILRNLKKSDSGDGSGKRFVIDRIVIRNVRVTTKAYVVGVVKPGISATIPEIQLTGIGSDSDRGVVLRQVVSRIVTGVLAGALEAGNLPKEIRGPLGEGLSGVAGIGLRVVGAGGKALDEVGDAVGGLLGRDRKKGGD